MPRSIICRNARCLCIQRIVERHHHLHDDVAGIRTIFSLQLPTWTSVRVLRRPMLRLLAMPDNHALGRAEVRAQVFGHVHRTMLSARAADRHRQIAAVVGLERWQPLGDEALNVGKHFDRARLRVEEGDHGRILAGERAQRQVVVGIRDRAHIEHEVGVERHADLEGE